MLGSKGKRFKYIYFKKSLWACEIASSRTELLLTAIESGTFIIQSNACALSVCRPAPKDAQLLSLCRLIWEILISEYSVLAAVSCLFALHPMLVHIGMYSILRLKEVPPA